MAAMGLDGADFASALKSRKKFVEANDEGGEGEGTGEGTASSELAASASVGIMGFTDKSPTGFCGLANQGATCYLNSLLQAMFMLEEFRSAVYAWEYRPAEHGDEERNVARQLQRLFAELQLSERCCVTTTALTRSFGWTTGEQFQQQDVQECSAVIMDYLSRIAVGTPLEKHLATCHAGSTNRILRCQCGAERGREEAFRDLQLDVKDASTGSMMDPKSQEPIGSVDRALAAYCATERLEGVSCEACGEKRDHDKLLRFSQLPLYLPLVLKRFAMNWTTGQRMKLSDWMSVPLELDLAPLLANGEEQAAGDTVYHLKSVLMHTGGAYGGHYFCYLQAAGRDSPWIKYTDAVVTELTDDEAAAAFTLTEPEPEPVPANPPPPPPGPTAPSSTIEGNEAEVGEEGKADEARGIECTSGDEEKATTAAAAGTIQAVWKRKHGGSKLNKKQGQPAVGKNAYMLVYVRADSVCRATESPAPPADLADEVSADNAKYRQLRDEWKEEQRWLRFKLVSQPAKAGGEQEQEVRILREQTVSDLVERAMETLSLDTAHAREDCRIRVVHRQTGCLLEPLSGDDGDETVPLDSLVKPRQLPPKIAVETRSPGGTFHAFKPGSVPIKLVQLTADGDTVPFASVAVPKPAAIGGLRQLVAEKLGCDVSAARMVVAKMDDDGQVTEFRELASADDFLTLSSQDLKIGSAVLVEDALSCGSSGLLPHFDKILNSLEISYRVVPGGSVGTVVVDGREPLLVLKQRLATSCADIADWNSGDGQGNDTCDAFKLRLGDRFGGVGKEIKDLSQSVGAAGFSKMNSVVAEKGKPLKPNEFAVTLKLLPLAPLAPKPSEGVPPIVGGPPPPPAMSGPPPPAAGPPPPPPPIGGGTSRHGADLYQGVEVIVSREETVENVKQRVVDLAAAAEVALTGDCMRLRLLENAGKLGAVLIDGAALEDALPKGKGPIRDGLKLAIQVRSHPPQCIIFTDVADDRCDPTCAMLNTAVLCCRSQRTNLKRSPLLISSFGCSSGCQTK
jgi:hypothetical protein